MFLSENSKNTILSGNQELLCLNFNETKFLNLIISGGSITETKPGGVFDGSFEKGAAENLEKSRRIN